MSRDDADNRERDHDHHDTDDYRKARRHERTERHHQHDERDRDEVAFTAAGIVATHSADVIVERRSTGDLHRVRVTVRRALQHIAKRLPQRRHQSTH